MADGGRFPQTLKAEHTFGHLAIATVVHITQPAVHNDQMRDQQHDELVMAVYRAPFQITKTSPQSLLDTYAVEEVLKEDTARVQRQVLRFESNLQSGPGFTSNIVLRYVSSQSL
jgi:hypothetical protein